jgi:AraC-like DNA-binding protein
MQHQEIEPPEELREVIKCFWYHERDLGPRPTSFEVVPDGYAELVFYFGRVCHLVTAEGLQPLPSPFMVGLLNQPAVFHTESQLQIIAIRCFPWTAFELLGLPAGKDEVRLSEHPLARLQAPLAELLQEGQVAQALTRVQEYFRATGARPGGSSLLTKAGGAMRRANGTLPVSQVAAAAHATVRTLERKFKQAAGYTVKDVSGLMRFERVRNHLWTYPDANLAGLAQELGYVDQAHLSREFKRYSGTTPAAFARRNKPGNQQ